MASPIDGGSLRSVDAPELLLDRGIASYQDHVEVYLRFMLHQPYQDHGATILVRSGPYLDVDLTQKTHLVSPRRPYTMAHKPDAVSPPSIQVQ